MMSAPKLAREARRRHDLGGVAIDRVGALAAIGRHHDERLDHQRHAVFFAIGAQPRDVLHALPEDPGFRPES